MPAPAQSLHPGSAGLRAALEQTAQRHGYRLDAGQLRAAQALERLYRELTDTEREGLSLLRLFQRNQPVAGVYLWGGVGRGKSFLMDSFFDATPIARKRRVHFHRFMQEVHRRMAALQGVQEPLRLVGREMARDARLMCLDEFHITDIGDAMIMRNLLEALFAHGVALVCTSNQHPDQLYRHGLQRAQFVPAIELIKSRMQLVELDEGTDYRLLALEKAGVFHCPLGSAADTALQRVFLEVAGESGAAETLDIEGRPIRAERVAQGAAWFAFGELCEGPRSAADYIELARRFHTVVISGVPAFGRSDADRRKRFTWLIDEFYDRRVKVVMSAQGPVPALFAESAHDSETDRTQSRLIEMQTHRYLGEAHLG